MISNNNIKQLFGIAVRRLRTQLGISQEELAERASLHRTYVSDVERGTRNVSMESIERLAKALNTTVSDIFSEAENMSLEAQPIKIPIVRHNMVEVLLVEDNPDDVSLTLHAFKKARLSNRIHVVNDGQEALNYVFRTGDYASRPLEEIPQIILLDLQLPKVSGLDVLRRLKADLRTRHIPVVVLTISDDDSIMAECKRLGVENYIVKPVDFEGLSKATPRFNFDWSLTVPAKGQLSAQSHASRSLAG